MALEKEKKASKATATKPGNFINQQRKIYRMKRITNKEIQ